MTIYNKLVRDKIPEYLQGKNVPHKTHIANDDEYWAMLKEKLAEEVAEFQKDQNVGELADILEVVDAIMEYKGFTKEEVTLAKEQKFNDRGGFGKRIILEES